MKAISNELFQKIIDLAEDYIGDGFEDWIEVYDELHKKPVLSNDTRYQEGYATGRLMAEADLKQCWVEIDKLKSIYYSENERLTTQLLKAEKDLEDYKAQVKAICDEFATKYKVEKQCL